MPLASLFCLIQKRFAHLLLETYLIPSLFALTPCMSVYAGVSLCEYVYVCTCAYLAQDV